MKDRNVKDQHNILSPSNFSGYTKPNGILEANTNGIMTFVPRDLPPRITYDREMIMLLANAERKVGELKGKGDELKNPHILLRSYLKREAVVSSRIEGTLASIEDLNRYEAMGSVGSQGTDKLRLLEVVNHVHALEWALEKIKDENHDVDLTIILETHKILMRRVRGQEKNPGKFRNEQNAIIKTEGTRTKVTFTPPPHEKVPKLLENLERFLQAEHGDISVLIQCAMIHYQFEVIHPFGDGNGRIGRLLILLILCKKNILPEPLLYLSSFFDLHLKEYYDGLLEVSRKSRWNRWIKFFLRAFVVQSEETIGNIQKLASLQEQYRNILNSQNASGKTIRLMEHLFENPYITVPRASKLLNSTYPTANNSIKILVKAGILKQTNLIHRSKIFVAEEIEDALKAE